MNKHCGWIKSASIVLGMSLTLLSGCGVLPETSLTEKKACNEAKLEISIDPIAPEGVRIVWDPALLTVDGAEVSVAGDERRTVVVTVELSPVE